MQTTQRREFETHERDAAEAPLTREVVHRLPKVDLHVHLDGSLRVPTLMELAGQQGVELPFASREELEEYMHVGLDCDSLEDYLKRFDVTLSVMQEAEAIRRIAFELAEDNARENVWYFEARFSPMLHTRKGMRETEVLDAVIEGLEEAERKYPIKTGIIVCGIRNADPSDSMRLAELAVAYKGRKVVAFDLAGAELDHPAKHHKEAFYLIRNNNINCTLHAGEAYGPRSIREAVHHCGTHRVGHGVRLKEDGDLLNYVNDHRIPLELCLTSNVQTRAVESLEAHPLRLFFDYGLRVTVNTDNRLMSHTTVTDELMIAVERFHFNAEELKMLIIHGFKSAFLPFRTKARLIDDAIHTMDGLIPRTMRRPFLRAETFTEDTRGCMEAARRPADPGDPSQ